MFFILFRWNKKIGAGDTLKIPLHWSLIYYDRTASVDLGSVIIDCETKHYNIGRDSGREWETRVANWNPPLRSIVTDLICWTIAHACLVDLQALLVIASLKGDGPANNDVWPREGVQICPWHFPVRKQWPQGSNEVLGPAAPAFPDQDGARLYDLGRKRQAWQLVKDSIGWI